ncbi:MAG TPA: adenine-specific methyltransferase EcoRI family protein [Rhizomicrobium sp.]|nr:adenine-specific methyltransferase EcoRI family protein [Rhizomicrobium sp.]
MAKSTGAKEKPIVDMGTMTERAAATESRENTRHRLGPSSLLTAAPPKAENKPNRSLDTARTAKKDEFYTQYVDIQKEVEAYLEFDKDTFRGKVVYCNCDDPFESNFFKYFAANFNKLGLKKLVTTSYDGSPIAGAQLTFGEYVEGNGKRQRPKAIAIEIEEVKDIDGDGAIGIEDVKLFLARNPHSRTPLAGGGDFRSPECVVRLKRADIVVTNPPFSLFREYVTQLVEHGKQFLIIGNVQAITYREVFPLIKADRLWMGVTIHSGDREFRVPDHYPLSAAGWRVDENGVKYIRVKGVRWYTNLDHGRRHQVLPLMTMADNLRFSKHRELKGRAAYARYDNFDAIEVPFTDAIPSDYDGVMGVPITFLDKYNPDQFEIVGSYNNGEHGEEVGARKVQIVTNGTIMNWNGPAVNGKPLYKRILIRHRARSERKFKK